MGQTITLQPGESVTITAASAVVPPTQKLYFTYFGGMEQEIFAYENMVFATTWGTDNTVWITDALTRAKAAGVKAAMVAIDQLCYTAGVPRQYVGIDACTANCKAFFDALKAAGVLDMVKAVYPIDEPELNGVPTDQIIACNTDLRVICSWYPELTGVRLAVTYSDRNDHRGIQTYDWIGIDSYDHGASVLTNNYPQLIAQLAPGQKLIIVPAGCNSWRTPIQPFYDYAKAQPLVTLIMAFLWQNNWDLKGTLGIKGNGMAPQYNAVATQIRNS